MAHNNTNYNTKSKGSLAKYYCTHIHLVSRQPDTKCNSLRCLSNISFCLVSIRTAVVTRSHDSNRSSFDRFSNYRNPSKRLTHYIHRVRVPGKRLKTIGFSCYSIASHSELTSLVRNKAFQEG